MTELGGTFTFPGTDLTVRRLGYGAMQLAGPQVFGPPRDHDAAIAVLRAAVEAGVDHIDTSDFYGPHVTNRLIREALHPYPDGLAIVTKVGARRGSDASWIHDHSRETLVSSVHDNLRNLGLDALDIVNLRMADDPTEDVIAPLEVLVELKEQGLIRHLGVSSVSAAQVAAGAALTPIVCVQNQYNLAHRHDDDLIATLGELGVAYVPFFPLGGFSPLQSAALDEVAREAGASAMQVALAWLLRRAPNLLLIPGTSSVSHLEENLAAAELVLSEAQVARLDAIGTTDG